jgi:hypothetical protein
MHDSLSLLFMSAPTQYHASYDLSVCTVDGHRHEDASPGVHARARFVRTMNDRRDQGWESPYLEDDDAVEPSEEDVAEGIALAKGVFAKARQWARARQEQADAARGQFK